MNRVSIVIPTLYPSSHLLEYAEKIRSYEGVMEVMIVVNNTQEAYNKVLIPKPESLNKSQNLNIKIKTIFMGRNKGFTGACNAGTRAASGAYLLFLNDDCEMNEESFNKLVEFLDHNPELVATQPIVYRQNPNPNIQIPNNRQNSTPYPLNPTPSMPIENIGFMVDTKIGKAVAVHDLKILKQVQNDIAFPTPYPLHATCYLYGLSGTCLLIKKDIFEKVGMFDESFHSYLEDVDLALKLRKFGYKFAPCLTASVTHAHMATSKRMGMYKPMQDMKNWWRLVVKHPDVFVHFGNLIPLLLERMRNINGLLKSLKTIRAQP